MTVKTSQILTYDQILYEKYKAEGYKAVLCRGYHPIVEVNHMSKQKPDFSQILSELPPIIPRKDVPKYLPGLISVGTLENLDARGVGPERMKIGKHIVYTREALIEWLNDRAESLD